MWSAMIVQKAPGLVRPEAVQTAPVHAYRRVRYGSNMMYLRYPLSVRGMNDLGGGKSGPQERERVYQVTREFTQAAPPTPSLADAPEAASGLTWSRHMTSRRISPRERAFPLALPPSPFIRDIDASRAAHRPETPLDAPHRRCQSPSTALQLTQICFCHPFSLSPNSTSSKLVIASHASSRSRSSLLT
jgi:hypothetical protein